MRLVEDPDDLAYAAAEIIGRELDVSRAGYSTIDLANETISIERDWNAPRIKSLAGVLHFRDYGTYIDDLKRGITVVLEDADTDPRTSQNPEALKAISAQSLINRPVAERGGFVAVLYLNHNRPRSWSQEEIEFVREMAERTRTAVEQRRARAELRQNEARLRFIDTLGKETSKSSDADAVLEITTRMLGEYLGVAICAYADMEPDQDHFTIRGDWHRQGFQHRRLLQSAGFWPACRGQAPSGPASDHQRQSRRVAARRTRDVPGHRHRCNHLHAPCEPGSKLIEGGLPSEIVMVVEDEDRVRAVSAALRELDYTVIEARGPNEAIKMIETGQQLSLLFTDVVMPEMSGRQQVDILRRTTRNSSFERSFCPSHLALKISRKR